MGALAELIKLGIKTASKQADKAVPKAVSKVDDISVFPKPQKMFPEDARPAGGEYLNPATQDILTGKNFSKGNISITPEGRPSFKVSPSEKEIVGSPDIKGATQIKTNLFKKKAGWKWDKAPKGYEDAPTLVSVENKGKHYYTLDAQFPEGVNLSRYAKSKTEPRLRPTIKGFVELGKPIGKISVRGKEHPVYDKIINREEGGQVLPVINKFYGGTVDEVGGSEERGGFDADDMYNTEDWTTPQARAALIASEAPSKGNANTDDYGPDGLFDLGYNRQELKDIRAARIAAYKQDALDKQNDGDGDIPYLSRNTKYDTTRSQYAEGPLTTQQINQDVIYKLMDQSKARKNYEREKSNWLTTLVKAGKATPSQKAELENLKSYYKVNPEDFKAGDREREEREEMLDAVDRAGAYLKGGFAPLQTGGQVLEGLDGEYMRKRNSKEKLEGMIGIQSRQYGGGLDDAYMNRRRSSAFAAPDATSAFDSPMSKDGLPTIYREQGGPLPITSVYGQGIPRIVYREKGGGLSDEDDSYQGAADYFDDGSSMFDDVDSYMGTQTPEEQAAAQQAAQDINDELADIRSDQQMNYEQYYGKSGDGRPSFTSGTLDPDTGLFTGGEFIYGRPGGPEGPSQQDYINRLNKEGFPEWTWPYYNSLKARGMTNEEATSMLAAAMSTPGGLSGMQSSYGSGYSYGGPLGTMGDLLEKGMASRVNINNLIEEDKDIKAYNKDDDEEFLSQGELVASGLKGIADDVSNLVSLKGNLTPTTMELIDSKFTEAGLNFTPASGAMGTLMNFLVPSVAKGLSNLTGAGRTIGTVTDPKTGQSFNVSDTGKFSLNLDPPEVDYGNDPKTVRKRKPVQKAVASTTEEKPLTGIEALLAKRKEPVSRVASNKYIEDLLKDLYPDPRNRPTLG